jgi:hypothetical protein
MTGCSTAGDQSEKIKAKIASVAGESAATMMDPALTFEVQEIRPLADFGQGWDFGQTAWCTKGKDRSR